jgi:site-specific DNA recombinase
MPRAKKPINPNQAAVYLRVSTDEQIEGFGLDVQRANCEQYAAAYSIPIHKVYADEGVSGKKPIHKRPGLSALLESVGRGEINQIIVPAIDRLARDLKLFLGIWDTLEDAGLKIILVKERLETDSASGMLMRNILATFADYERSLIAERTTGGRRARARTDGERGGTLPLGYIRIESGKFDVEPLAAGLVRHIFSLRHEGNAYGVIAAILNAEGFTTQRGKQWHGSSVREIVRNEAKYRGAPMNGSDVRWPLILAA